MLCVIVGWGREGCVGTITLSLWYAKQDSLPHELINKARPTTSKQTLLSLYIGGATRIWEGCAGEAVELGRLVSPAGREMVTVMDASPMLAALPLKADLSSTASANRNARIKVGG